jgi:hypothetical protein
MIAGIEEDGLYVIHLLKSNRCNVFTFLSKLLFTGIDPTGEKSPHVAKIGTSVKPFSLNQRPMNLGSVNCFLH